ncbi:hypothetical protein [Blastococcus xanthinilyticus]|uniref:Uncharacterized protein n=1 Tax=Blastococcus xanthinilyticus TaxID=1564164 RepID=A0A5S5CUX6_9ACTN|nr:hypothetical protein [Blastococcus xanthinilyticus]TYP87580.1 hypothetical protein BD833_106171 [Blastococcus xanthinilyticus]
MVLRNRTAQSNGVRERAQLPPSLDDLIRAYTQDQRSGSEPYEQVKLEYQRENGKIKDEFYARNIRNTGAVLIQPPGFMAGPRGVRRIRVRYDNAITAGVQPSFEAALWRARALERESGLVLGGRSRKVLTEMIFVIIAYLLGVLDSLKATGNLGAPGDRERIQAALDAVKDELERLDAFRRSAARKASLRWYLVGLPIGGAVIVAMTWSARRLELIGTPPTLMQICLACGGIGAIVSVMVRITRGQNLVIDSEQGHAVTLLAGAFRPLIGAVFGAALYVFMEGGLLPIARPGEADVEGYFFASVAFLAGFSERWAQDTIVRSVPTLPSIGKEGSTPLPQHPRPRPRGSRRRGRGGPGRDETREVFTGDGAARVSAPHSSADEGVPGRTG